MLDHRSLSTSIQIGNLSAINDRAKHSFDVRPPEAAVADA
jgi:hypothetical protein